MRGMDKMGWVGRKIANGGAMQTLLGASSETPLPDENQPSRVSWTEQEPGHRGIAPQKYGGCDIAEAAKKRER